MSVDVDAVNERLNGLVTLLKAVGVDGETARNASADKNGAAMDMARQLNDEQIEAIIKKLQQAQTEAPQIIAALEAHAEARSLNGSSSPKSNKHRDEEVVEEEVVEEQTEIEEETEEDDDEFDEDANYPMVGHGVSDDISVVSDLTTPTVLAGSSVPEEEHYRETLPPMIIGGVGEPSMIISAPKRKNLVSQVRAPPVGLLGAPGARGRNVVAGPPAYIGPPVSAAGGAAAARRKMYQDTMAKLAENPNGLAFVGPSAVPSKPSKGGLMTTPSSKSSGSKFGSDSSASKPKKKSSSRKSSSNTSSSSDWNSFEEKNSKAKSSSSKGASSSTTGQTVIDDDGFLVGDCNFDPFAVSSNPFKSPAGDLEFGDSAANKFMLSDCSAPGGFAAFDSGPISGFGGGSSTSGSPKKSKGTKTRRSSTVAGSSSGDHHRHHGSGDRPKTRTSTTSGTGAGTAAVPRQRRGRRMSVS
ncbi:hypothetical protein ACA910_021885 [Epithemia clementina (nom. ined.)]